MAFAAMSCFLPLLPFSPSGGGVQAVHLALSRIFLRHRIVVQVDVEARVLQGQNRATTLSIPALSIRSKRWDGGIRVGGLPRGLYFLVGKFFRLFGPGPGLLNLLFLGQGIR